MHLRLRLNHSTSRVDTLGRVLSFAYSRLRIDYEYILNLVIGRRGEIIYFIYTSRYLDIIIFGVIEC